MPISVSPVVKFRLASRLGFSKRKTLSKFYYGVKAIRDIWDEKKIEMRTKKEMARARTIIPEKIRKEHLGFLKARERSLAEIRKHLLDYLERKKRLQTRPSHPHIPRSARNGAPKFN